MRRTEARPSGALLPLGAILLLALLPGTAGAQLPVLPPDLPEPTEVSSPDSVPVARSPFEVPAGDAGMSEEGLRRVDSMLRAAVVVDSVTPGAVLAVGRRGRLVRLRGYGWLDWSEGTRIATPATVYDLASLTKPVAAATAVMLLVDDGRLELDDPVTEHLPWWAAEDPLRERATVRDLLRHRSGLPGWLPLWREREGRDAFRRALAEASLEPAPGVRSVYSDLGYMTLAFLVEAVAEEPLDALLRRRVWEPLGMIETDFRPDSALLDRIAPTEVDTVFRHRHVRGEVHDENAWAMGGVSGHAGLFSTGWDLAIFAQAMLEGQVRDGPGTDTPVPCGWQAPTGRSSAGDYLGRRSFGHTGFTGTSIWIDPELELFVVLLTNRVNPTRERGGHTELRRAVHDAVALAVADEEVGPRGEVERERHICTPLVIAPSTSRLVPLVKLDAGLARKAIERATSSGRPIRPMGFRSKACRKCSGFSRSIVPQKPSST